MDVWRSKGEIMGGSQAIKRHASAFFESSKSEKAKRFTKESAALLGVGFSKVISRTLWWAGWGALFGAGLFFGWWAIGGFTQPWPWLEPWLSGGMFLVYVLGGIAALGYAGFWRGIGRFTLYVGIERGLVSYLLDQILTRLFQLLRKSSRLDKALDKSAQSLENLPLKTWETKLKKTVGVYLEEEDPAFQVSGAKWRVGRAIRAYVAKKIEGLLLAKVRAESHASGGGGISMKRVETLAHEETEDLFAGAVLGAMKTNTLMTVVVVACASAVVPMLCYGTLHWQQGVDFINAAMGTALALLLLGVMLCLYNIALKLGLIPEGKIGG